MDIAKEVKGAHDALIGERVDEEGNTTYKILKDYSGTYIEKQMQKEEKMIYPIFRVFLPVKPESHRKLNIDPEHQFDPYTDSLLDYPSIISAQLREEWGYFNRLICVQIPLCLNKCWHCYLPKKLYVGTLGAKRRFEELSAKEIAFRFIHQRESDKNQGKHSNVLRITGGEPFLLPKLILDCLNAFDDPVFIGKCLDKIKGNAKNKTENEARQKEIEEIQNTVFLWTETNLEPFIGSMGKAFMDIEDNQETLKKLGLFKKQLAVHPCFHGLDKEELNSITGKEHNITLNQQIKGLKRLLDAGIELYPTFGSNVCNPKNAEKLFKQLMELDLNLPFRVALVKYDLQAYPPVKELLQQTNNKRSPDLYSRFATLRIWNKLLLKHYGIGYAMIPRHVAKLKEETSSFPLLDEKVITQDYVTYEEEIVYFFKGSARDLYHREILDYIALPTGHIFEMTYDKKRVQDDAYLHMSLLPEKYKGKRALWIYVGRQSEVESAFLPFRKAKILEVSEEGDIISFKFELGEYISWKGTLLKEITHTINKYFGTRNTPFEGKYLLLGEKLLEDNSNYKEETDYSSAFPHANGKAYVASDFQAFRNIVQTLVSFDKMRKSLFYRVFPEELKLNEVNNRTLYKIKGGKSFKIKLEYFLPNYNEFNERNPEERTIYFESSSSTITPWGESKVVLSKYGSEELLFKTDKVTRPEEVIITFSSRHDSFMAAKAAIRILVLPTRWKDAGYAALGIILLTFATAGLAKFNHAETAIQAEQVEEAAPTIPQLWGNLADSISGIFRGGWSNIISNLLSLFAVFAGLFLYFWFYHKITIFNPKK